MTDAVVVISNRKNGRDEPHKAGVQDEGGSIIARLEKIFFLLLALCPFALGAVFAFVNMTGGWARFSERRDYAFYRIFEYGFSFLPGGFLAGVLVVVSLTVARRFARDYESRRELFRDTIWLFLLSFGLRALFFLAFGVGMGNSWDPLWSWERACGLPVSDNRHVLFPAWMNFAFLMKVFVSLFGNHFNLFQFMETVWGGVGSVAVLLLAREISRSRRWSVAAGLLHALSPNGIVYLTAGATPEHAAAPLFSLSAWLFLRSVMYSESLRRVLLFSLFAGLCLGLGDAIKPFFPVFFPAVVIFSAYVALSASMGRRRAAMLRGCLAVLVLLATRCVICSAVTSASERAFGCRLSRSDSEPHFLCVGLDRWGEGMTILARHAQDYRLARLAGVPREKAAAAAFKTLKEDWRGHLGEIPYFLFKKTIWAWQEDVQAFHYYWWNQSRGYAVSSWARKALPAICKYGASAALVYYFIVMVLACLFSVRTAFSASSAERQWRMLPGLIVMGFFCLMLLSESQGRYKCLIVPFVTTFAACAFQRRCFPVLHVKDIGDARDRLCVVMPVYNEREAIGPVLEKWVSAFDALGLEYVIRPYNDGSRDDSLDVMRAMARKLNSDGRIRVDVRDKPNGGHGNTILTGYREASADGFSWIFQIDSDDEMGPERFSDLWKRRNDFDFLLGTRDGRVQPLSRKMVSFVSRLCVRLFYGKSVWDVNTPYRLMRVSAFRDFYFAISLTTFAPNVILSGLAARHGLRSFEIRVPQHNRTTGEVSIKRWKLLKCAARSFWQTVVFSFSSGDRS